MPSTRYFDTMESIGRLERGRLGRAAAEAIVELVRESAAERVAEVERRIDRDAAEADLESNLRFGRNWLVAVMVTTAVAPAAYLTWMVPLLVDVRHSAPQKPVVQQVER